LSNVSNDFSEERRIKIDTHRRLTLSNVLNDFSEERRIITKRNLPTVF